jgi:small subunit ribosomal protein S20
MPNIKGAGKRMRQAEKAHTRNKAAKTEIKHVRREVMEATTGGVKDGAETLFRRYCSVLDRAAKKGIIKKNTAIRRKTRAAARLRAKVSAPAAAEAPAAPTAG